MKYILILLSIFLKHLNFYILYIFSEAAGYESKKTLVDLLDLLLKRRRSWNINTKLKFVVGNTELCILHVTGKVEHAP